jgi:NAD(P)-dependent dehydrogenase (short-subunit alcohol dehydrogenase family)
MFDFYGKVAIITGAARGIGKNIAIRLADSRATVVIADINESETATTIKILTNAGKLAVGYTVDLSSAENVVRMISDVRKQHGRIDILVNNARGGRRTEPLNETSENIRKALEISLEAPLFASQEFIRQVDSQDGGCIVNISSVAAHTICGESAAYHIVKAGLENLTRYLAVYGGEKGVRVNAVRPGFIVQDEHISKYSAQNNAAYRHSAEFCHPVRKVGTSDDIANAVLFLCSGYSSFITGQILTVDGGLTIQDQWNLVDRFRKMNPDKQP